MSDPARLPTPLPDEFMRLVRVFQESRIVLTAVELDVFTAVGDGATVEEVARRTGTDLRGMDLLLHALSALGLVGKRADLFSNSPLAARHLCAGVPDDQRGAVLHSAALWQHWSLLTECVRSGRPVPRGAGAPAAALLDFDDTEAFMAAMHQNAAARAPQILERVDLRQVRRMLDVGGGSGGYAIAFLQAVPGMRAEILDLPDVLPIALRNATAAGVADRLTTRVANLRADDLGRGFDLVLISSVCHMCSREENADLMRRAAAALEPGGRVIVQDYVLEEDRASPRVAAVFAVNMLVNSPNGANYTEGEYANWMRGAGLGEIERIPLQGPTCLMVGRKP